MPLSLFEFGNLIYNKEELIDFLIKHGVLTYTIKCNTCDKDVNINKETLIYRCRKRYIIKNSHKKRCVSKQCNFEKSARAGTWFDKNHLDISTICKIVTCFLMLPHPRQDDTQDETNVSASTLVDWFNSCQEICVFWADKNSQKLGGPGCIVELDEAKIDRQFYNCERLIKGHWIYGGYECESKKIFLVPVEDWTERTLLAYRSGFCQEILSYQIVGNHTIV